MGPKVSRWLSTCLLYATTNTRDSRGVPTEKQRPRRVCCNPFSMGAQTYFQASAAGVHPVAVIQLHKCDYRGERLVKYNGQKLNVSRVDASSPDYVVLTLAERTADRG